MEMSPGQHYVDGMLAFDLHAMEAQLRAGCPAEVRFASHHQQQKDFDSAVEAIEQFVRDTTEDRNDFDRMITEILQACEMPDRFLSNEERESAQGIAALLRVWAPRYASLRMPETWPIATFNTISRGYNDTLTRLVRTMVDCAIALDQRVADERAEDAEADDWAARNPNWQDDDDEFVPFEEVVARLYPNEPRTIP